VDFCFAVPGRLIQHDRHAASLHRLPSHVVNPNRLLIDGFFKKPEQRPYCFVTDGGLSENLGLVELLRRNCQLIIVVDTSFDPKHEFADLAQAIRTARIHGGVRLVALEKDERGLDKELLTEFFELKQVGQLEPGQFANHNCARHLLAARIRYRHNREGLLIYIKPSITGDESIDVLNYRSRNRDFPHESSNDQVFDAAQVESYRQLGYHIGMELCSLLPPIREGEDLWPFNRDQLDTAQICQWLKEGCCEPPQPEESQALKKESAAREAETTPS
jgi:hypothetical protein